MLIGIAFASSSCGGWMSSGGTMRQARRMRNGVDQGICRRDGQPVTRHVDTKDVPITQVPAFFLRGPAAAVAHALDAVEARVWMWRDGRPLLSTNWARSPAAVNRLAAHKSTSTRAPAVQARLGSGPTADAKQPQALADAVEPCRSTAAAADQRESRPEAALTPGRLRSPSTKSNTPSTDHALWPL